MKSIMCMSISELKDIPVLKNERFPIEVNHLYFKANKNKHESGYNCIETYIFINNEGYFKLCNFSDILRLVNYDNKIFDNIYIDCSYRNKLFHIFSNNRFKIAYVGSDINFEIIRGKR